MKIWIDGKIVAKIEGKCLIKHIKKSHYLTKPPAVAIDEKAIRFAQDRGVEQINIFDVDNNLGLVYSMKEFLKKSFRINRGYGPQLAIPVLDSINKIRAINKFMKECKID